MLEQSPSAPVKRRRRIGLWLGISALVVAGLSGLVLHVVDRVREAGARAD
jgi:hypothetical protein